MKNQPHDLVPCERTEDISLHQGNSEKLNDRCPLQDMVINVRGKVGILYFVDSKPGVAVRVFDLRMGNKYCILYSGSMKGLLTRPDACALGCGEW